MLACGGIRADSWRANTGVAIGCACGKKHSVAKVGG